MISLPLGVPLKDKPSVYIFPLTDILDGVALESVALPPERDNVKSEVCKDPLPPVVL